MVRPLYQASLHNWVRPSGRPFFTNNSLEPIMKTTLGAMALVDLKTLGFLQPKVKDCLRTTLRERRLIFCRRTLVVSLFEF